MLTIDLCLALRPPDRRLFDAIPSSFSPEERPVPIGIAITGLWMSEHPQDLAWLRQLEQTRPGRGDVDQPRLPPLSRNFLLEPGTDLRSEILATKKALVENGLRPSLEIAVRRRGEATAVFLDDVPSYSLSPRPRRPAASP